LHITSEENLTPDRVGRLLLREVVEGKEFAIRFEKSKITDAEGNHAVDIKCELEDEDLLDFFEKEGSEVLQQYGVDVLELECIILDKDNPLYLVNQNVICLTSALAIKLEQVMHLAPETMPSLASYFGAVSVPMHVVPLALQKALLEKDRSSANKILRKLRSIPSQYGSVEHKPKFELFLGRIKDSEEKEMVWPI